MKICRREKSYSCYPNCQFYTVEAAQSFTKNYSSRFVGLLEHETYHNVQAHNNPLLAELFHPSGAFHSSYHGFSEGAADYSPRIGGPSYQANVRGLEQVEYKIKMATFYGHIIPKNDIEEIHYMKLEDHKERALNRTFQQAKFGFYSSYESIRNFVGPQIFDSLFQ